MSEAWKSYTYHDFVQQLAQGTLPVDSFKSYLVQDYLYLVSQSPQLRNEAFSLY